MPDSAYEYLYVGCFFNDSLLNPVLLDANGAWERAYVFIDDVCVSNQPGYCDSGTSYQELVNEQVLVSPNPFSDHVLVNFPSNPKLLDVSVVDVLGRTWSPGMDISNNGALVLMTSGLPLGPYYLILDFEDGRRSVEQLLKTP